MILASLSVIVITLAGCGESSAPAEGTVTGIVTGVESDSLVNLASLTVEDQDGVTWRFAADGFVGMTPSHLRLHEATREAVTVTYTRGENGIMVLKSIADAAE